MKTSCRNEKFIVYLPMQRFRGRIPSVCDEKGIGCKSRTVLAAVSLILPSVQERTPDNLCH